MYDDAVENIPLDEDQKENLLLALEQLKTQVRESSDCIMNEFVFISNLRRIV